MKMTEDDEQYISRRADASAAFCITLLASCHHQQERDGPLTGALMSGLEKSGTIELASKLKDQILGKSLKQPDRRDINLIAKTHPRSCIDLADTFAQALQTTASNGSGDRILSVMLETDSQESFGRLVALEVPNFVALANTRMPK